MTVITNRDWYLEIAQAAVDDAVDLAGRMVIYARVTPDGAVVEMLYLNEAGNVRLRFPPPALQDLVVQLWNDSKTVAGGGHEWREMNFVLDGTKFKADFLYPEQAFSDDDVRRCSNDLRKKRARKYFGDAPLDLSEHN